jgi:Tfp pilus assembly protein PilW
MGVVTMAIFRAYVTQHKNYMIQEDITDMQQSARASIDELSRNIRMAGYELPVGLAPLEAYNTNPDTIVMTYNTSDYQTFLSTAMADGTSPLQCGSSDSGFTAGDWVYIYEADSARGEWFQISDVQASPPVIAHTSMNLSRAYGEKSLIIPLTRVKFYIDNVTDPSHPNLMMQLQGQAAQVYAENVSDLQFKYKMKGGQLLDVPDIVENVRDVEIQITGRSEQPELADNGDPTYRDRTFSTAVYLRNVGI